MSYSRGLIYVTVSPSDGLLRCMSPLHPMGEHFKTGSHLTMIEHLAEHREDADEIMGSIGKAINRLKDEIGAARREGEENDA